MNMCKTFLLVTIILLPIQVFGQQYQISRSVINAGSGIASDSTINLPGTVGQPLIGESKSQKLNLNTGFWNQAVNIVTYVEDVEKKTLPDDFELEQNYPNPFNPRTTIQFAIPHKTKVVIKIYNLLGRQVSNLVDADFEPGTYKVNFDAEGLSSGIYFYRLETDEFVKTRKLMLLK